MNFLPVSRYRIRSYTGICRPAGGRARLSPSAVRRVVPRRPRGSCVYKSVACTRSSSMPGSSSTSSYVHLKCGLTLCDCPYVYERSDEDAGHLEAKWAERVQTLLIDRAARRRERDYARADAILEELQGMGVAVDDKQRLWSVTAAAAPTTQEAAAKTVPPPVSSPPPLRQRPRRRHSRRSRGRSRSGRAATRPRPHQMAAAWSAKCAGSSFRRAIWCSSIYAILSPAVASRWPSRVGSRRRLVRKPRLLVPPVVQLGSALVRLPATPARNRACGSAICHSRGRAQQANIAG